MWDTVEIQNTHLSHDPPCPWCGHAAHVYLPCDKECGCRAQAMPGAVDPLVAT